MIHEPTSLLVFRNGSIGNTLAAVPALRALRARYPNVPLSVIVDSIGKELLEHCPWIDRLITYDKRGKDRGWRAHWRLARALRRIRPSHAILFKRFFRNGLLAFLSGARERIGFRTEGRAPFLNWTIPYDESVPVVDLNLRLVELLNAVPVGRHLEMFLSNADLDAAKTFAAERVGDQRYVTAHYGGLTTSPDFVSPRHMRALLERVAKGRPVFLIGAGEIEHSAATEIARSLRPAIPACGLPVRMMAALVKSSDFFVGFDSGPAHIAAATATPALVIFKPDSRVQSEIRKWCPPGENVWPLIPPTSNDETEWMKFASDAERTADKYDLAGSAKQHIDASASASA